MDHAVYCGSESDSRSPYPPRHLSSASLMHGMVVTNAGDADSALYCNSRPPTYTSHAVRCEPFICRRSMARLSRTKQQAFRLGQSFAGSTASCQRLPDICGHLLLPVLIREGQIR
jgi:hypothetical protein